MKSPLLAVCVLLCGACAAAGIDRPFLTRLLSIPSVTADIPQVNAAEDAMHAYLTARKVPCVMERDDAGRKILWASTRGEKTPDYVLCVHLDVVPVEHPDQFKPYEKDGKLHARGAHDCKGNAVLAAQLLCDLLGKASVGVVFASNEEIGGSTVAVMVARGYRPRRMAIVLDAGTYGVFYAQKGNAYIHVRAVGHGGHSSLPMYCVNPLEKLMDGYAKFRAAWPAAPADGWGDLITPTIFEAGNARNRIPDTADMWLNLRSVSPDAVDRATKLLKEKGGFEIVEVVSTGHPMTSNPNDPEMRRLLAARRAKWPDKPASMARMMAITDARHYANLGLPVAITGSLGAGAHGRDEWTDLANLDENLEMLESFVQNR